MNEKTPKEEVWDFGAKVAALLKQTVKSLKKTQEISALSRSLRNTAVLSLDRLQHKAEAEGINVEL